LVQIAKSALEDGSANFAWAVFDKDGHPRIDEAYVEANTAGVKIAFSSRSFEEWVLMHFEKNNNAFLASECKLPTDRKKPLNCGTTLIPNCQPHNCLSGRIRRQNFIPNYSKKRDFDLFNHIKDLTEIAIVNTAWLRSINNLSLNFPQPPLHNQNPYADTDQIILDLHNRLDKIEWGNSNTIITLDGWSICVNRTISSITITVSHNKHQPIIIRPDVIPFLFYTTNDVLNNILCTIISKTYINNSNGSDNTLLYSGDVIEYTLSPSIQPYFLFKVDHLRIFVV
jgi:hypothetical protein